MFKFSFAKGFFCFTVMGVCSLLHAESAPSPVNQVFQFSYSDTCSDWPDKSTSKGTLYLWIPEKCERIRGLIIMGLNVPEHRLAGHADIRQACIDNHLGLVFSVPSFWNFAKIAKGNEAINIAFLERLLAGLAQTSGYDEVAHVPWLVMGESGHLLMVTEIINLKPERVIAGVCIKNQHRFINRSVPVLRTFGTAQEWGQSKGDILTSWKNISASINRERDTDTWPQSYLVEMGTGHFYCTDEMTRYFKSYISESCKARLTDGSNDLKPVDLSKGYLAELPYPGYDKPRMEKYSDRLPPDVLKWNWFFTKSQAEDAQKFAEVNWEAQKCLPGVERVINGEFKPFSFNSVTEVRITTQDEFEIVTRFEPIVPSGFVNEGQPLATPNKLPKAEWVCGPFEPVGDNRFRVSLDRTWKGSSYLCLVYPGSSSVGASVQPLAMKLIENSEGQSQTITFKPVGEIRESVRSVKLEAESSSGLPVRFFVKSGPAIVEGNQLILTPIPPRSAYPVKIQVVAWQWGIPDKDGYKTAPLAEQTIAVVR